MLRPRGQQGGYLLEYGDHALNQPMQHSYHAQNNVHILYNEDLVQPPLEPLFDRNRLLCQSANNTQGRGSALIFVHQNLELVLKHYQRGGMFGHLVKDSYVFTGLESTRMWQEFKLLCHMRSLGLPVPQPVAARCERTSPISYAGDLITERISSAQTLAQALTNSDLPDSTWIEIGQTIARFHRHNIYHADLNANNVMVDYQHEVFLIDFDKGAVRLKNKETWAQTNLDRLLRSLHKLKANNALKFSLHHWDALKDGYRRSEQSDQ